MTDGVAAGVTPAAVVRRLGVQALARATLSDALSVRPARSWQLPGSGIHRSRIDHAGTFVVNSAVITFGPRATTFLRLALAA